MAKFRDQSTAKAPAKVVKFVPGESWKKRHKRRFETNLKYQKEAIEWCRGLGVTLAITNDGQHWSFRYEARLFEWWPSTAKLVMDKRWKHGIHTHDFTQAMDIVSKEIGL